MKQYPALIIFLVTVIQVFGQNTFERKNITPNFSQCCPYSFMILETPDHGFVSAGKIAEGLVSYYYWEKIDSTGQFLWGHEFGFWNDSEVESASMTADSGFIICGNASASIFPMGIVKTNSIGTVEWYKIIGVPNMDVYGKSALQTKDHGYIIAGSRSGPGNRRGKLIKLDSLGNVIWSKAYGASNVIVSFNDIIETPDSGFITVGWGYSQTYADHTVIVRSDSNGDTLWTRKFKLGVGPIQAMSIISTYDSCYIISGHDPALSYSGSFFFKINASGDTLWKKEFSTGDSIIINSIEQVNDSGLIIGATQSTYTGLLIKTNSSGDILWSKQMPEECKGTYAIQTKDQGFAVAGGPMFNVVKTDSL